MTSSLESRRFPYLPLHVQVHDRSYSIEALIDTGFDGDVVVPMDLIAPAVPPDGVNAWLLADASEVITQYYLCMVRLGDVGTFPALLTVLGDEALVGRRILDRLRLILDHGERVIVET